MSVGSDDYDSPWKEAVETFLPECLAFFFPQAYVAIDWTRGHTFLDQELRQVQREAERGRQVVDKLVQVYRLDGTDTWVLVHIEVQSQAEVDFAQRMFTYYYRLLDRFDHPIVSVAILGDERPTWRPDRYVTDLWGYGVQFTFRSIKLLDYRAHLSQLEDSRNPFATIVLAHLQAQQTRQDPRARLQAKLQMLRRLYGQGYNREQIIGLFRFIDWLLALPPALAEQFWDEVAILEQEEKMPYITSVERIGIEKGLEQGRQEGRQEGLEQGLRQGLLDGIALALKIKFGAASAEILLEIQALSSLDAIRAVYTQIETAQTLDDVRRSYC